LCFVISRKANALNTKEYKFLDKTLSEKTMSLLFSTQWAIIHGKCQPEEEREMIRYVLAA